MYKMPPTYIDSKPDGLQDRQESEVKPADLLKSVDAKETNRCNGRGAD